MKLDNLTRNNDNFAVYSSRVNISMTVISVMLKTIFQPEPPTHGFLVQRLLKPFDNWRSQSCI